MYREAPYYSFMDESKNYRIIDISVKFMYAKSTLFKNADQYACLEYRALVR